MVDAAAPLSVLLLVGFRGDRKLNGLPKAATIAASGSDSRHICTARNGSSCRYSGLQPLVWQNMRFVADGPEIPNHLIKKWRKGEVLFLAGAGVSVPSQLPLFEGLALKVYQTLGESLFDTLNVARKRARSTGRAKILDAAALSPEMRVEANLFFDKQFDRFFSALEKRIDPDLRGRAKTRNVRNAVEAILGGKVHSDSHKDILLLSNQASPDRSKPSSCRVVTTNFDLLFESAWRDEFGTEPLSYDARMAPRPGAHNFEGIIHLHGSLNGAHNSQPNYILTSRDFARVYLRSGVIGNYVYELVRRFSVVLIGYSADDPPMRYLMDAIGEDASLFADMKAPYAITDLPFDTGDPRAAVERAV
jgi:NAD-dependent SIR2 family protein deacetylase